MTQRHAVFGFFDDIAEAQQAVQLLLAKGFTPENVDLSTHSGLNTATGDGPATPTEADSSGRFLTSLFGSRDAVRPSQGITGLAPPEDKFAHRSSTLVTVQTQSTAEANQVAELLDTAGAGKVAVEDTDQ